jgi:peptidoglycan/LPS O-acetylase OafA/YrhL
MRPLDRLRPEIQALRAVAIMLVLVFHIWPWKLPGGYIGVDVFFVISGFLITKRLLFEIEETGAVSVPAFWARRARRLLPASLLVLLASMIAIYVFLPRTHWRQFLSEIEASVFYLENWKLAADGKNYWNRGLAISPIQHYWSLSLEEQLYFIWPALLAVVAAITPRTRKVFRSRALAAVFSTVTAGSLAYCISAMRSNPDPVFFDTFARAWEFSLGGLLALLGEPPREAAALQAIASWAGLAAIASGAALYSENTAFPGYAALLPVLGASAVIWARAPEHPWAPSKIMKSRVLQFLGDISYPIYLWHWPIVIILPQMIGRWLGARERLLVFAGTIIAAWLTKIAVEDPVRKAPFLRLRKPRFTFAMAAGGMVIVIAAFGCIRWSLENAALLAQYESGRLLSKNPPCLGAAARDPKTQPCLSPGLDGAVIPNPIAQHPYVQEHIIEHTGILDIGELGVPAADAASTFAIVGDSHAHRLLVTLESVARAKRWRGFSIIRYPAVAGKIVFPGSPEEKECDDWNMALLKWLGHHPEVTTLFTTSKSRVGRETEAMAEFIREWKMMPRSIKHIVVIRDNPLNLSPDCVERALERARNPRAECFDLRAEALPIDAAAEAAKQTSMADVIDLTDFYCDARNCYHVIGGVLVYKDSTHLTLMFARTLAPYFLRKLNALEAKWMDGRKARRSRNL